MTLSTHRNAYGNLECRTQHTVPDHPEIVLEILTMKRSSGRLCTTANGHIIEGQFKSHRVYTDYSKQVSSSDVRCTQKVVIAQHEAALGQLASIQAEAKACYDALTAKEQK